MYILKLFLEGKQNSYFLNVFDINIIDMIWLQYLEAK